MGESCDRCTYSTSTDCTVDGMVHRIHRVGVRTNTSPSFASQFAVCLPKREGEERKEGRNFSHTHPSTHSIDRQTDNSSRAVRPDQTRPQNGRQSHPSLRNRNTHPVLEISHEIKGTPERCRKISLPPPTPTVAATVAARSTGSTVQ